MAKPMEFQMTDVVALQEVVELICRCVRIHHIAVLLGEHIVKISPTVAEVGDMLILLQMVLCKRFAESLGDRDGSHLQDTARRKTRKCIAVRLVSSILLRLDIARLLDAFVRKICPLKIIFT